MLGCLQASWSMKTFETLKTPFATLMAKVRGLYSAFRSKCSVSDVSTDFMGERLIVEFAKAPRSYDGAPRERFATISVGYVNSTF